MLHLVANTGTDDCPEGVGGFSLEGGIMLSRDDVMGRSAFALTKRTCCPTKELCRLSQRLQPGGLGCVYLRASPPSPHRY